MRDLEAAGLISVRARCERTADGTYRGLAAVRYLPAALFGAFGLAKWLRHERSKAALRQQRRVAAAAKRQRRSTWDTREHARGQLWLRGLQNAMAPHLGRARPAPGSASVDAPAEFERQVQIRAGQIKQAAPFLQRDACFRLAHQQLAPPG